MFAWASETFEKLSQHVAPPATDPISRYIHACQRSDQEGAMIALQELGAQDLAHYQVIPGKGQTALHVACLYAQIGIVQHILQYYSHALTVVDQGEYSTPLCGTIQGGRWRRSIRCHCAVGIGEATGDAVSGRCHRQECVGTDPV